MQGYGEWNCIPQELFQMQPWRMCDQPIQLHCTRGQTLLQTPPHPTDKRERQLKPARRRPWEGSCKWESRVMICRWSRHSSYLSFSPLFSLVVFCCLFWWSMMVYFFPAVRRVYISETDSWILRVSNICVIILVVCGALLRLRMLNWQDLARLFLISYDK